VVRKALADVGVPLAGVRVVDGSGLSRSDRVTARELVSLLAVIAKEPQVREIVTEALPVAGRTGTLSHRLESLPAGGLVRAKTGTTDIASALSGYVGRRYAFVVVQNGHPVDTWAARAAQDRFVQALAAQARAAARADRAASIR